MAVKWPPRRPLRARGKKIAFREFEIDGGDTIIGLFQGGLGERPELDTLVAYQRKGRRVRAPKHVHWAIDLLLKRQHQPDLTRKFVDYLLSVYEQAHPYVSVQERIHRPIASASGEVLETYALLNQHGEYSVEFTIHIVEIMAAVEKTLNPDAFMFKQVLQQCAKPDSELDIHAIISTASFRGR